MHATFCSYADQDFSGHMGSNSEGTMSAPGSSKHASLLVLQAGGSFADCTQFAVPKLCGLRCLFAPDQHHKLMCLAAAQCTRQRCHQVASVEYPSHGMLTVDGITDLRLCAVEQHSTSLRRQPGSSGHDVMLLCKVR